MVCLNCEQISDKSDSSKNSDDKITAKDTQNPMNENQCPICLEYISNRSMTDPCRHEFCVHCLRHWSNEHNFCPVCRQVFDTILYNFRDDNRFDSKPVNNRQSRVRRSLIAQRDALRESLNRTMVRVDQQMTTFRRRLREREEFRNRISDHFIQINSIDRQTNEEIDQTLSQVRNTINEINYQNFIQGDFREELDYSKVRLISARSPHEFYLNICGEDYHKTYHRLRTDMRVYDNKENDDKYRIPSLLLFDGLLCAVKYTKICDELAD